MLSSSVFVAVQGIFIGFEAMKHFSLILVVQAVFQGFLAPALVYFGYGAYGAVLGYALASIIVGVVSLVVLYFSIFRSLKKDDGAGSGFFEVLKPLLHYGVPLAVASISAGMLVQFFYFMMAIFCSDAVIGNYRVAINFGTLLTFFSFPVSTVLFPVFSKLHSSLDRQVLKSVFKSAVKYTAFLLVPATFAMMVLAQPIIGTLYGGKWLVAPWFLFLSVLTNLLAIVGNLAIISLLAGLGETKFLMKLNLLAIAIGVPLGILLIPVFGIEAVIISALIAVLPGTAISLYFVRKKYDLKVDYNVSLRILLASVLAATATYGLLSVLKTAMWLQLLFGFLLFVGVYLLSAPLVGAISPADVSKLRTIFSGFGLLSTFLFFLLGTIERILKFRVYRVTMKNK